LEFCEELRARRHCAEQGNPSSQSINPKWRKGVTAMVKNVLSRLKTLVPASLVLVGWLSFVLGIIIPDIHNVLKLSLLSVARVLP
jgi:hypothetical protein